MTNFEDVNDSLDGKNESKKNRNSGGSTTRRGFIAGLGTLGAAGAATYVYDPEPEFTGWGRFRIQVEGGLPFQLEESIPLVEYSDSTLESIADNIQQTAEEELDWPSVRETENKVLMDTFYFTDDEILEAIRNNDRLVGDKDQITRLIDNKRYATMKMGIKMGGETADIRQYLEKDLRVQYVDNISEPFQEAFQIAYEIGAPRFDIGGADERNDQFIGMELYALGNGRSRAGRYFNTTEIQEYSEDLSALEEDLEKEAERQGGFEFFL